MEISTCSVARKPHIFIHLRCVCASASKRRPTLVFAVFSIFLAHWVNRIPEAAVRDPGTHALLFVFSWTFVAFLAFQIAFAIRRN